MLEINKLTGGYVNIPVLKEVSFSVPDGQLIGLIGLNGAGKSTLLKILVGEEEPTSGQINKKRDLSKVRPRLNCSVSIGFGSGHSSPVPHLPLDAPAHG